MAINLGSAYGKVGLDASGIKSGVSQGVASLRTLETAGLAIGGAMQKIGGAMTLGLTLPIIAFFKKSVDSAIEAESALAELNAVLASTGSAAGLTADEITHMAAELQKVTKFSDDQIISGQSMLLTFTKIGKDVFPLATEAMLNMAEKFGSVEQASVQLGKALNDPIGGVTALRRVGVMLTQEQEDQIKGFMAVNDIASAQKIILSELETEFGGLARTAGNTTAGKLAQLTNAFDDLKETVGAAFIPTLLQLAAGLTKLIEKFMAMPPWMQKVIIVLMLLLALAGPVIMFVGTIISAIGTISGFVASLSGLGITLAGVGTALATVGTVITGTLIPAIIAMLTALAPILLVIAAIGIAIGILYLMWKYDIFGMRDVFDSAIVVMKRLWEAFTAFWRGDTEEAVGIMSELFGNFERNIQAMTPGLADVRAAVADLRNGTVKLYEDGSGALMDLAVAFGLPEKASQDFLAKIYLIADTIRNVFSGNFVEAIRLVMLQFGILSDVVNKALLNITRGAELLYEDGSGALLDLATAFGIPAQAAQDFLSRMFFVASGFIKLFRGDMLEAVKDFAVGFFGITNPQLEALVNRFHSFALRVGNSFRNVANTALQLWAIIKSAFSGIGMAVDWLVGKIDRLKAILASLKLPKALTPGSPTPFETGLRGVASAMDMLSNNNIPNLQTALARPINNQSNSQQQTIVQNFAGGLSLKQVRGYVDERVDALANQIITSLGDG